jgi:hypothetical protein
MSDQPVSVGRVVHYLSHGTPPGANGEQAYRSECRAAIVTETPSGVFTLGEQPVGLAVLNPEGMFFKRDVPHDEDKNHGGTWHWPERV